jgi:toxin FitB
VIRYLLDTNIISEIHKPKPHGAVLAWFHRLQMEQICLSAVTLGELQEGIERMRAQDPAKAAAIETWVDQLEAQHDVIPMDSRCFREAARLMRGKQEDLHDDAMIAATARIHSLKVATRNERDFVHFAVEILNPFKS